MLDYLRIPGRGSRLDPQRRQYLARQRPLHRHLRRPSLKHPRPRSPLDLLLVALPPEGVYPDLKASRTRGQAAPYLEVRLKSRVLAEFSRTLNEERPDPVG